MLAYVYPLLSMFALIFWWFFVFAVFFGVIWAFMDNFRRRDHSGWAKAGWAFFILILPLLGMLDLPRSLVPRTSTPSRSP